MTGKVIRDITNLLLYGGGFIGLCAACLTAFTFELTGTVHEHLPYILLVGTATGALYSIHKIIGIQRTLHVAAEGRFVIIRKFHFHIRVYAVLWAILSIWLLILQWSPGLIIWLMPGGLIAFLYVMPVLPGGKRMRDLGWGKIVMLGWSWSWLTCVIPMGYFIQASPFLTGVTGLSQMCFVMLLGIAFDVRDLRIDQSLNLLTIPEKLGRKRTLFFSFGLIVLAGFTSMLVSYHYFNLAFGMAMSTACLLSLPLIWMSYKINDDYFFSGIVDGMMILIVWIFSFYHMMLSATPVILF